MIKNRISRVSGITFILFLFCLISSAGFAQQVKNSYPGFNRVGEETRSVPEYAPDELIVKYKAAVEQDMASAVAENKVSKSSLAELNKKYKIKKAIPLFRKRFGKTTSEAKKSFQAMIEKAKAKFSQRAESAPEVAGIPDLSNIYVLKVEEDIDVLEAIREYSRDPNVEYAEPNYKVYAFTTPDDPSFSSLWGLHNTGQTGGTADADIDAPEAWDIETGSSEVVVAVIDTGVDYNHEDLAANMWTNTGESDCTDSIDNDGNGYIDDCRGWDFYNDDNDPYDDNGHGTHCSGTIGAVGNNGVGVAGVNWNLRIMPLKFLNAKGSGWTSDAVRAVLYAVDTGAKVMSNSWGGAGYSHALKDAIQAADDAGILFIAAAGNSKSDNDSNPMYPASYDVPNIISVAATDHNDELAGFSSYGATMVDLGAPGVNVYSTIQGNSYGYKSGTSMATPHVAGVAGLALSRYPGLTVSEVKARILLSVDPVPSLSGITLTGGRLNAYKALAGPYSPPIASFLADVRYGTPPFTVQFTDMSVYISGPTRLWDFGDGGTGTGQNPSHTYTVEGDYNVSLTITNNEGSDTMTRITYIKVKNYFHLGASNASFIGDNNDVKEYDRSGMSVSSAGDVNGDGYDDILIGAPSGKGEGMAYLIFGKAWGWSMDTPLGEADASFIGENAGDYAGGSVSSAGDVNGDGYDDIIIGAKINDEGGNDAGQSYLILGKAGGWSRDTPLGEADASFIGESDIDLSGISVSSAGDVNGDGFDDILIGAYCNSEGGDCAGQTYLIFGKAGGWSMDTRLSEADASFIGENAEDYSGSVSSAGDVNADGFDDILIGAQGNDEGEDFAGKTYLIFGKVSGWSMDTSLGEADASFTGESEYSRSGLSVSSAGDINGNGFDDILIGAIFGSGGVPMAGKTYLIFGKASGWSMDNPISEADASFIGEDTRNYAGYSVSSTGDVNGDGFDDILIGAYGNGVGGNVAGQTYLVFGKAGGWSRDTPLGEADTFFIGEYGWDQSGYSVSSAGDVNSDGFDDILIGAYGNGEGGSSAGQTYLILGRSGVILPANNPPSAPQLVYPADGQTGLGTTVTFRWKRSTDPDGNSIIYYLSYCDDRNFTGCTPIETASLENKRIYYAWPGAGLLLFGIVLAGGVRGRRKTGLLIAMIMAGGILIVSCGGDGGSSGTLSVSNGGSTDISYRVSGLNTGATYYWKVVADDGYGGAAESEVRSFTTW